ncbi:MAG TPA: HAD family phosphatase, partial [Planctomycetota bacterium]|nr:HAD family phosphatase [Planctomycetota bacterium]
MGELKAVIFDLDGVLVDSEALHVEAWRRVFAACGIIVSDEEYAHGVGMADGDWLAWLFTRRGPALDVRRCLDEKRRVFAGILKADVRPFPGVVELVTRLHPECRLGVASNSPRRSIETALAALRLRSHFDAVAGADDVKRHKPHPEIYLHVAARLAIEPARCTVIEDSALGIQAAKAAGMRCIGITNSLPAERLAAADLTVASLADADSVLRFVRAG